MITYAPKQLIVSHDMLTVETKFIVLSVNLVLEYIFFGLV